MAVEIAEFADLLNCPRPFAGVRRVADKFCQAKGITHRRFSRTLGPLPRVSASRLWKLISHNQPSQVLNEEIPPLISAGQYTPGSPRWQSNLGRYGGNFPVNWK